MRRYYLFDPTQCSGAVTSYCRANPSVGPVVQMQGPASVTSGSLAQHAPTWFMPPVPVDSLPELLDRAGLSWQSDSAAAATADTRLLASFECKRTVDVKCYVPNVVLSSAAPPAAVRAVMANSDVHIYEIEQAACFLDRTTTQFDVDAGCTVTAAQVVAATAYAAEPSQPIGKVPPWTYVAQVGSIPLNYSKPAIIWRLKPDAALDPLVHLTLYSTCPRRCAKDATCFPQTNTAVNCSVCCPSDFKIVAPAECWADGRTVARCCFQER